MCVTHFNLDVAHIVALQVFLGESGQFAVNFNGGNLLGQVSQQSSLVARAGTNFEHTVARLQQQFLSQTGFDFGREHGLVRVHGIDDQWQLGVRKGRRAQGRGNKAFALDLDQCLQHFFVGYVPGTDLLFHHVVTGTFEFRQRKMVHSFQKTKGLAKSRL